MEMIELQEVIKTEIEKVTIPTDFKTAYNLKSLYLKTKEDVKDDIFISILPSDYEISAATRKSIYEDDMISVVLSKHIKTEDEFITLNKYAKSVAKQLMNKSFKGEDGTVKTYLELKIIKAYDYDDVKDNKFDFVIGINYRSLTNLEDNQN